MEKNPLQLAIVAAATVAIVATIIALDMKGIRISDTLFGQQMTCYDMATWDRIRHDLMLAPGDSLIANSERVCIQRDERVARAVLPLPDPGGLTRPAY